jgi:F0F1-type ATP synthase membrane subunit c/vacuolar-type H+-ATPase subunit K
MNQLRIIHYALLAGQIIFAVVVLFTMSGSPHGQNTILIPVAAFSIGASLASGFIYKMLVNVAKNNPSESSKMMTYRTAKLVLWAMLEAPALFAIIAAMVTCDKYFLFFAAFLFVFSFAKSCSQEEFEKDCF